MPNPVETFQGRVPDEIDLPSEDRIYFNGFQIVLSPADAVILLMLNGKTIKVLNASHTAVKTLAMGLGEVITEFEKRSSRPIMTIDEIQTLVTKEAQ